MASVGFGTMAPAVASPASRSHLGRRAARSSSAHVPAATKSVAAAAKAEEKGLFDLIFGPMFKEEQLLETDPVLNKVEEKAPAAPATRKAAGTAAKKADAGGNGGFSLGGLFSNSKER